MAEDKNEDKESEDEPDSSHEDEEGEGGESEGEGEEGKQAGAAAKKKLFIIIGGALLLLIGGAAAAYFSGLMAPVLGLLSGGEAKTGEDGGEEGQGTGVVFHDLPEILVNLNTGGRKSSFLKVRISLELAKAEDIPKIESVMPRVIDNFQVYLRELRIDDLKGSAGMYRLREELLMRANIAAAPTTVNDVLFKEMIIQ